ncbi:hypothetical protein [Legionella resiliens]|uniref:SidC homolog n=1 Tax=Legionella resiliens TaxID=2905958 RepID=A0ABS8X671_9GAMM|nr:MULTISPECIES: hypothetical protein [unclassified Legionella]MCE0723675.1 hypothetical protein [Legionella sp. 9fVS26]MCE3532827.1 hypothetical protein [Legionella sp. 8cVS16]
MGSFQSKATNPISDFETLYQQAMNLIEEENPQFNTIPEELKQDFLNLNDLIENEQLELIKKLSQIKNLPKEMEDVVKKFPYFNTLPDCILKEIGYFIKDNPKDLNALVTTDRRTYTLFQPDRILSHFLQHVAYGERDRVEKKFSQFMPKQEEKQQSLLRNPGTFTDYSGRTFHCTAYEYAYWAKDKHMCRMLEQLMDETTKARMLKCCEAIEKNGLTYKQSGVLVKGSKHFDFTPLKNALRNYIDGYDSWYSTKNWTAMENAWMQVGLAQRELPVHVINEYCRKDRSFDPTHQFNEETLPWELSFYNYNTDMDSTLFPLVVSASSGLGVDFALFGVTGKAWGAARCGAGVEWLRIELAAVERLDEVRTADRTQSRENLKPVDPMHELGN